MKGFYQKLLPVLVVLVLVCLVLNYSISGGSANPPLVKQSAPALKLEEIHSTIVELKPVVSKSPPPPAKKKKKIAYAITITKDGEPSLLSRSSSSSHRLSPCAGPFLDGALVLGHSCLEAQKETGTYDAELVAFVTPGVVRAREVLSRHGWVILEQQLPVTLEEITNPVYVKKVRV